LNQANWLAQTKLKIETKDKTSAPGRKAIIQDLKLFILGIDKANLGAFDILEPNTEMDWGWHHDLMVEELTALALGENRRVLLNVAPRSLKSLIVSVFFPAWVWLRSPWESFLCLSYSGALANDHSYKRRQIIESAWYQLLSKGKCELSDNRNRIMEFSNVSGGVMYARGLDGSVTGIGGTYLIVDDPNNPENESDVDREAKVKKLKSYLTTRANNPKKTKAVLVQQRTHEQDGSGYVLKVINKEASPAYRFRVIKLPTRSRIHETITFPRSGKVITRKPGELLHPSRFGEEEDAEAKRDLGAYGYSARHDQEPAPLEGGVFSHAVWKEFKELPQKTQLFISGDLSFGSTSNTASYVAIGLFAVAYPDFYLVDTFHKRCGFKAAKTGILDMLNRWEPVLGTVGYKLIEKKASGSAMIEQLGEEIPGVIPFNPDIYGDKKQRAELIAPVLESGNFYIKEGVGWGADYKLEFINFGVYDTDDYVDMTSQVIIHVQRKMRNKRSPVTSIVQS
jgi:predicted phage terminase large subunit-like protein